MTFYVRYPSGALVAADDLGDSMAQIWETRPGLRYRWGDIHEVHADPDGGLPVLGARIERRFPERSFVCFSPSRHADFLRLADVAMAGGLMVTLYGKDHAVVYHQPGVDVVLALAESGLSLRVVDGPSDVMSDLGLDQKDIKMLCEALVIFAGLTDDVNTSQVALELAARIDAFTY